MKPEIKDLIWALAEEVARLKEDNCGNSGKNWLDVFIKGFDEVFKDK